MFEAFRPLLGMTGNYADLVSRELVDHEWTVGSDHDLAGLRDFAKNAHHL